MISIQVETPTNKQYQVEIEGSKCIRLIKALDEIKDMECQAWIYERLCEQITNTTPYFIGDYLGYTWRKLYN